MNESIDRVVADWLDEGPERGPRDGLERALAATRRVGQRPGWTIPERWLPMQLTMTRTPSQRPIVALAMLALLMVALVATTLYVGSQRRVPTSPFGNGAVVYAQDGNLFIADQLDGPSRVLVRGGMDSDPVFSDQGDQIAFLRGGTDSVRIMSVRPNGSDLRELADLSGRARLLGWSPDGSSLLAQRWRGPVPARGHQEPRDGVPAARTRPDVVRRRRLLAARRAAHRVSRPRRGPGVGHLHGRCRWDERPSTGARPDQRVVPPTGMVSGRETLGLSRAWRAFCFRDQRRRHRRER